MKKQQLTEYVDFTFSFSVDGEDGYRIIVDSPAGSCNAHLQLPFSEDELAWLSRTRWGTRDMLPVEEAETPMLQRPEVGRRLFNALLTGCTRDLYHESRAIARQQKRGLRLRIRFDPEQPAQLRLAALPWELMRGDRGGYLALSRRTPIVREPRVPQPPGELPPVSRLRVLAVVAMPEDQRPLQLQREWRALEDIWCEHPTVQLDCLSDPDLDMLRSQLDDGGYHVLHFMGHGDRSPDGSEWMLCFTAGDGGTEKVLASQLAEELDDFSDTLRLVVLNACKSGRSCEPPGGAEWSPIGRGVAMELVAAGCTTVVAMQERISDDAAIELSKALYHRLAAGDPIDRALTVARKRLRRHEWLGKVFEGEWAVPVLLLRCSDASLYDVNPENAKQAEPKHWWPVRPDGLGALAAGIIGLALLVGLGSLWVWQPAPLRYAAGTAAAVVLGGLAFLVGSDSRMLLSYLSCGVARRFWLIALLVSLPLLTGAGWWFIGFTKIEQLRCSPLKPRQPGDLRVAVGTFQHQSEQEAEWAFELPGLLVNRLRCLGDRVQVLHWPEGAPAKIADCCIDMTISGSTWQDRDVHLKAILRAADHQVTTVVQQGRPDELGSIEHLTGNLLLDIVSALGIEATKEQSECLQAPPTSSEEARGYNRQGVMLLLERQYQQAESAFRGALHHDHQYSSALSNLGLSLLGKQPPEPEEAVQHLRCAISLDGDNPVYHFNLGLALEMQGINLEKAAAAYEMAISLDRGYTIAYNNLGSTLVQLGRLDQAHDVLLIASDLAVGPEQRSYVENNLGLVVFHQGDSERAVVYLESALELSPELPQALYWLARSQEVLAGNGTVSHRHVCATLRRYLAVADFDPDESHRQDARARLQNLPCGE
jgi:Flp pilus assembly protein TadD